MSLLSTSTWTREDWEKHLALPYSPDPSLLSDAWNLDWGLHTSSIHTKEETFKFPDSVLWGKISPVESVIVEGSNGTWMAHWVRWPSSDSGDFTELFDSGSDLYAMLKGLKKKAMAL